MVSHALELIRFGRMHYPWLKVVFSRNEFAIFVSTVNFTLNFLQHHFFFFFFFKNFKCNKYKRYDSARNLGLKLAAKTKMVNSFREKATFKGIWKHILRPRISIKSRYATSGSEPWVVISGKFQS